MTSRKKKTTPVTDLNDLVGRSTNEDGAIDLHTFDSFIGKLPPEVKALRHFGGERCDVMSGPCACGAWH